jgi:hypothetical protein
MSAKISQYSTYDCDPDLELAHAPKVDPDAEFPFQFRQVCRRIRLGDHLLSAERARMAVVAHGPISDR